MYELRSKSFQLSVFLAVVYVCSERMYWVIVGMSFFHAVIWGICLQLCFVRSKFYNIVCGLHLSSVSACLFVFLGCFGFFFFEKPSLSDIDPKVMEKKIFKNTQRQFSLFSNQLPYQVDLSLYLKFKLKVLDSKGYGYTTFVWHWPKGSGEDF